MTIRFDMLRVFRTVAEKGSLSAAADALNRTPSAVSMMLSQLTDQLGAPLFETDRKNRLTPLGRLVLDESRRAVDAFERSADAIQRHVLSTAGTVRIASVPSAAVSLLPAVISSFHRLRPDVRLVISDADSQAVRRRVRYDEADIGIVSASPQHCVSEDVILQDSLGIVYRPGGSIAEALEKPGTRPSWELLLLEPLIVNPLCHMVDNPRVHVHLAQCTLEARNTTALLSCVQRGLGATVLPPNAVTTGMADVAFIQPDDPPVYRVLQRIRSEERHLSPVGEAFWQALSPQQAALSTMRQ